MNEQAKQEALRHAREAGRKYGMPDGLGEKIMQAILEARGHISPSNDPFNDPSFGPDDPFDDLLLDPGWDDEREPLRANALPFAAPAMTTATVTTVLAKSDGSEFKIVRRGHRIVQEYLYQLGHPELARTIGDFHEASQSLEAMQKEKDDLKSELERLRQFVAEEPTLIAYAIKRRFPDGTAGKIVSIDASIEAGGYRLIVGGTPTSIVVPDDFGQTIAARQEALEQANAGTQTKSNRRDELCRQIADAERALPVLEQKTRRLFGQLDRNALAASLNGELIGLDLDASGQPVVIVRRTVNEVLTELPEESKLELVAQCLQGRKLPEAVQEALGIKAAIDSVRNAFNPPAPTPELPPEAKATAKPRGKGKRQAR